MTNLKENPNLKGVKKLCIFSLHGIELTLMDGFGKSHIVAKNIILLGQAHLEVVDRQLDRAPFRPKLRLDGELRWAVRRPMSHKHIPMP
jgi:hypothetical protein